MHKLAVCVAATKSYCYAAKSLIRSIGAQVDLKKYEVLLIWGTCGDEETEKQLAQLINKYINGINYRFEQVPHPPKVQGVKGYETHQNLYLAELHTAIFHAAKIWGADYCWSVEGDVLPPPNALRTLTSCLEFDGGFYGVAMATYPDQSGGSWMGGRGSATNQIAENYAEEETEIPARFTKVRKRVLKLAKHSQKYAQLAADMAKAIRSMPPKFNVFTANGKRWRARGWLQYAYPAIGRGSILPTDWTGLGCVLMSRESLEAVDYSGYNGGGTGDLYLNWFCWEPAGIRRCVTTHAICSHVVRERNEKQEQDFTKLRLIKAYHENAGEMIGHLRTRTVEFTPEL